MELKELKDPKYAIVSLLKDARKYIYMSTGLHPEFYGKPDVQKAITDAAERVKVFRLLVDGDAVQKLKRVPYMLELVKKEKIDVKQAKRRIPHWLIVDGKHFRLEKLHPPDKLGEENLIIRKADSAVSGILLRDFRGWWASAEFVDLSNLSSE